MVPRGGGCFMSNHQAIPQASSVFATCGNHCFEPPNRQTQTLHRSLNVMIDLMPIIFHNT